MLALDMHVWGRRLAMGCSVAAAAVQLGAQPERSQPAPQVWKLDWIRNQCAVSTGDSATAAVVFLMTPGDPDPAIDVVGPPNVIPAAHYMGDPNRSTFTVTLGPGGETFQPVAYEANDTKPRVVELHTLYRPFALAFARSSNIQVQSLNKSVSIPIVGAGKAVAAVKECADEKLAQWGVDVRAYNALRVPATDIKDREWISYTDYPDEAVERGFSGQVIARLDVDAGGKVTGCNVVVPSGLRALDEVTCRRALERGLLEPAIGADGRPTASQRIVNVQFRVFG